MKNISNKKFPSKKFKTEFRVSKAMNEAKEVLIKFGIDYIDILDEPLIGLMNKKGVKDLINTEKLVVGLLLI